MNMLLLVYLQLSPTTRADALHSSIEKPVSTDSYQEMDMEVPMDILGDIIGQATRAQITTWGCLERCVDDDSQEALGKILDESETMIGKFYHNVTDGLGKFVEAVEKETECFTGDVRKALSRTGDVDALKRQVDGAFTKISDLSILADTSMRETLHTFKVNVRKILVSVYLPMQGARTRTLVDLIESCHEDVKKKRAEVRDILAFLSGKIHGCIPETLPDKADGRREAFAYASIAFFTFGLTLVFCYCTRKRRSRASYGSA